MGKIYKFFKDLRPEYRVALFFFLIVLSYTAYSFISDKFFEKDTVALGVSAKSGAEKSSKPSTITESLKAERPVIISTGERQAAFKSMMSEKPEVKDIELTAEVANPAVWIYMNNDGSRRDNLASEYCQWIHSKGVMAASITILDIAARAQGKIVEMGESRCM